MSPREIARMLTEDPDILNETTKWNDQQQLEADEVPVGDRMYFVKFTVGATVYPGEAETRYYDQRQGGLGNPGSPPSIDWEILSIDGVEDEDAKPVQASEELRNAIKEVLYKKINEEDLIERFGQERDDPRH